MSGERLTVRFEGVERTFEPANSPVRIGRDDKEGRMRQFAHNGDFFGAPAAFF